MVLFLSFLSRQNKRIAPTLLKHGLSARFAIIKKTTSPSAIPESVKIFPPATYQRPKKSTEIQHDGFIYDNIDNPLLDSICLLPIAQKMISIEIHDDMMTLDQERREKTKERTKLDEYADQFWEKLFGKDDEDSDDKNSNMSPLLQSFEDYVFSALFPHSVWGDRHRWQFNHRFVMWLRKEFLIAKYGQELRDTLKQYPNLKYDYYHRDYVHNSETTSAQTMIPDKDLPSKKQVIQAFQLQKWSREQNDNDQQQIMIDLTKSLGGYVSNIHHSLQIPILPDHTKLYDLTLEQLLELTGAHVSNCGVFNLYCEQGNIYELWTQDYIDELAKYLVDRTMNAWKKDEKETLILEVGAGDGTLSKHLRKSFERMDDQKRQTQRIRNTVLNKNKKTRKVKKGIKNVPSFMNDSLHEFMIPKLITTDDGSWNIKTKSSGVEKMNVHQALEKYAQNNVKDRQIIVLCSWMMKGVDWTIDFRASDVDEYILIGESDDGCCGHNWNTWGNLDFIDIEEGDEKVKNVGNAKPPYEVDNFERIDLEDLSKLQFSRYDSVSSRSSNTVSFRRSNISSKRLR